MDKHELIAKLKSLKCENPEYSHEVADDLLLEYINDPEIAEAFLELERWYS